MRSRELVILGAISLICIVAVTGLIITQNRQSHHQITNVLWDSSRPVRGSSNPVIKLVEFGDYQCPSCATIAPILDEILQEENDVGLQFHYLPLPEHKNAIAAVYAAETAAQLGKFWEMHDMLFSNQSYWQDSVNTDVIFPKFAVLLGLDELEFSRVRQRLPNAHITDDAATVSRMQLISTPTFFINDRIYDGILTKADLRHAIEAARTRSK